MFGKLFHRIPPLDPDRRYLTRDDLTPRQEHFLDKLRLSILDGRPISVGQNYGYLYALIYEAITKEPLDDVIELLISISSFYGNNEKNVRYYSS